MRALPFHFPCALSYLAKGGSRSQHWPQSCRTPVLCALQLSPSPVPRPSRFCFVSHYDTNPLSLLTQHCLLSPTRFFYFANQRSYAPSCVLRPQAASCRCLCRPLLPPSFRNTT
ncbi:hypothetical protein GE21DRAFT_1017474 [Neurospora crassa]|nr:hypothetical protein 1A9.80 [imported] - Neurospora crassa [Neurospora crassa]KHE88350.1 hypothetical protein GE21DRAFT_1017474 [Neurospora crassa]